MGTTNYTNYTNRPVAGDGAERRKEKFDPLITQTSSQTPDQHRFFCRSTGRRKGKCGSARLDPIFPFFTVWYSDEDLGGTAGADSDIFYATSGGGGGPTASNGPMLVLPDSNGNLADEGAYVCESTSGGSMMARVMDASTGAIIVDMGLPNTAFWTMLDVVVLADSNANGAGEIAYVCESTSGGSMMARVMDASTGAIIVDMGLPNSAFWTPLSW